MRGNSIFERVWRDVLDSHYNSSLLKEGYIKEAAKLSCQKSLMIQKNQIIQIIKGKIQELQSYETSVITRLTITELESVIRVINLGDLHGTV